MALWHTIQAGGLLMCLLGVFVAVASSFVLFFSIILRRSCVVLVKFVSELREGLSPHSLTEAKSLCSRHLRLLQGRTQYLRDIATVALLVCMLGTVAALLQTFDVVGFDLAKVKPMLLEEGLARMLIACIAGLIIAIPATAAYVYFRGKMLNISSKVDAIAGQMDHEFI